MTRKRITPLATESAHPGHCSRELRYRILSQSSYFKGLSPQALEGANAHFREQHYLAASAICREAEPATRLFFVAHGKVKLLRHSMNGEDVVLDILTQGALFGGLTPLGYRLYSETAIAQTDCCVLAITADAFRSLLERYPEVALEVLNSVARDLDDARETIRQLATSSVEARIATVLIKLAERLGEKSGDGLLIQSPLPQQDLAAMVGATSETVSRVMARFKREGLIDTGRQWVRIVDPIALQAVAGT